MCKNGGEPADELTIAEISHRQGQKSGANHRLSLHFLLNDLEYVSFDSGAVRRQLNGFGLAKGTGFFRMGLAVQAVRNGVYGV